MLLMLLCASVFLALVSVLIMSPLLVSLASEFKTSVAVIGQLIGATAITWAITAPVAGPIADSYGRRRMLRAGLLVTAGGILGAGMAWDYASLLAFRLLTGVGAAMVPPNSIAILAEAVPPAERGRAMGWMFSATGVGVAFGVPLIAALAEAGGWRLPFYVVSVATCGVWILCWWWLPTSPREPQRPLVISTLYREAAAEPAVWYALAANTLERTVFFGMFAYLAAHLIQSYGMTLGATALPLVVAGSGAIVGGYLGGRIADHPRRLGLYGLTCVGSGLLAALAFTKSSSPWTSAALAFGAATLTSPSLVVTSTLLVELAGRARATAAGLFAVSNQLGAFAGPALGGVMLAAGGFSYVGVSCFAASLLAAVIVRVKIPAASPAVQAE